MIDRLRGYPLVRRAGRAVLRRAPFLGPPIAAVLGARQADPEPAPAGLTAHHLQHLQRADGSAASLPDAEVAELAQAPAAFAGLTQPLLDRLVMLFVPGYYRRLAGLAADTSSLRALAHFLREGLQAGLAPSPLFDADHYARSAAAAGLGSPSGREPPALHWARAGVPARIVPTPLFDEAFYLKTYPDVAAAGIWGFYHFLEDGVFQGRRPSAAPRMRIANGFDVDTGRAAPSFYRIFTEALPAAPGQADASRGRETLATIVRRHQDVLGSALFAEVFARAVEIEPRIGEIGSFSEIYLPPFAERLHSYLGEIRRRLRRDRYDHVICIPWVRMGGADLVSGHLAQGLHRLKPGESILVLRTETSHLDRPEWFPDSAELTDISDVLRPLLVEERTRLLYHLFVGIGPKHIFNVNSRQCWETFQRFGRQLSTEIDLFGCLFAWGYAPSGRKVGYASEYFSETSPFLKNVVTDNTWIKGELIRHYALPPEIAAKIVTCWMPTRARAASVSAGALTISDGERRKVLWAGRLDREKRFDILLAVARAMPDVDFLCWGASVLDAPIDLSLLPANVTVQPPFNSPDDLPLGSATAWLYTSASDGMPNLVVELASAGVPIVASAVGGVPELIRPDTGWPIGDLDNPQAYVSALREIIADPGERLGRATRLQQLALSRHNVAAFDQTLSSLLEVDQGIRR